MTSTAAFQDYASERDPRWEAVDDYVLANLHPPSKPNHKAVAYAMDNSLSKGLPDIATYPVFSKFLALQCRMVGATHALEVGTLGGYTSIWLATENPKLKVTTIEFDQFHAEVACENIAKAGVQDRVEVIVGAALDVLPKLYEQIQRGEKDKLGFTYIDADKINNYAYFDWAVKMSAVGACLYVDNVVRYGKLADANSKETGVIGSRQLVEKVGKDKRVDAIVMQTVSGKTYDGYLCAVKIGE